MQYVNVRLEKRLNCTLTRIDPNGHRSKDSSDFNTISGSWNIAKLVIAAERDGMGCLSIRDIIGCLLELYHLLVLKFGAIVHYLHGIGGFANRARTFCGFGDFPTVELNGYGMTANMATEKCCINGVRNNISWKKSEPISPLDISGMIDETRITSPLIQTILSMSSQSNKQCSFN
jgi:hypothetical protein